MDCRKHRASIDRGTHRRGRWHTLLATFAVVAVLAAPAAAQPVGFPGACTTDADCGGESACSKAFCLGGICGVGFMDCNDQNTCTQDSCDPTACGGTFPCLDACVYTPGPAGVSCADGDVCDGQEQCDAEGQCAAGTPAAAGTSCADGDVCDGSETCDGSGSCAAGTALVCNDGDPCTTDGCAAASGCTATTAPAGTSCSDGDACNGDETCDTTGACAAGAPPVCDDGNPCTTDGCAAATGCTATTAPAGTSCADADACNGDETCDTTGACAAGTPLACDDGDLCTHDTCVPESGCVADAGPTAACIPASAGSLLVDEQRPGYERVVARLADTDDEAGDVEFGNPLDAVDYALCFYDGTDSYVGGLEVDGGDQLCAGKPCWRAIVGSPPGARRFFYKDGARSNDGVAQVLLRSARARGHDTSIKLSAENHAKRGFTALPSGLAAALSSGPTATMQLVGSDGTCVSGDVQASPKSSATVFRGGVR